MKGLLIWANGFEDVEAIAVSDILNRANIEYDVVSYLDDKKVTSSHNLSINLDKSLSKINYKEYDFLVLPGGAAVFKILDFSKKIEEIIDYFISNDKLTCAICAAPLLIGKLGYLNNKNYTVFPGCEQRVIGGKLSDNPVVVDNNIITARSMYYSVDFALEIVRKIKGNDLANKIALQVKGLER